MKTRLLLGMCVCLAAPGAAAAREPDLRLDLSAMHLPPAFFAVPFVFQDSGLDCPEDRRTITVSNGELKGHYLSLPLTERPALPTLIKTDPIDDVTYRLQYARASCRVDIDIRQQVRVDGEWKPLLVIDERRPSLSVEERQAAMRQRLADVTSATNAKSASQADLAKINEMLRPEGPPRWTGRTMTWDFPFQGAPASCMEAFGEYRITKDGFAMAFFAPLPADLNKFVIEGADLDESHARIDLTKDDCRFEFTISQSAIRNGKSIPIPLRPLPGVRQADPKP
jgi:hypothetical protein